MAPTFSEMLVGYVHWLRDRGLNIGKLDDSDLQQHADEFMQEIRDDAFVIEKLTTQREPEPPPTVTSED